MHAMTRDEILKDLPARVGRAVAHYWEMRTTQRDKQRQAGRADQGLRSAVTGGAHMDGFIDFFTELIVATGIPTSCVHRSKDVELPGFFRPTKEWDLLVIRENTLLVAIEAKSQVGPSFGNNFNNRTEEAMGSRSTFGPPTGNTPILQALNRSSATSSCWRTAPHPTNR
jgi:hypothetical protein